MCDGHQVHSSVGFFRYIYIYNVLLTEPDKIGFDSVKEPLRKIVMKAVNSNKTVNYQGTG